MDPTLLLVEDQPDDEQLFKRALSRRFPNAHVTTCHDGAEALERLETCDNPRLIVLDLKLPRLSGIDVLAGVRDHPRFARVPIVILTSSDEGADIAACWALGCNAFVKKPLDYDEYMAQVGSLLDFWLTANIPAPEGTVVANLTA